MLSEVIVIDADTKVNPFIHAATDTVYWWLGVKLYGVYPFNAESNLNIPQLKEVYGLSQALTITGS